MTAQSRAAAQSRSAARPRRRRPPSRIVANILTYALLTAGAVLMVVPYVFSIMTSLKTAQQFASGDVLQLPSPVTFDNYTALFGDQWNFLAPIAVTAQMVLVLVVGQMFSSVLAAYAFATLDFPGREAIFWVYVACLMIPAVVTVIPLYTMISAMGLRDTFWALVIPYVFGSPYAIFLLRENFRAMPSDLLDAATLDGAGTFRILWNVMLPMNKPILATLFLITVVTQWNSFMWPRIITVSQQWRTLTVATSALQSQYNGNWTLVMAATTVAMAPLIIIFLIFQRQITRAIGITGVR